MYPARLRYMSILYLNILTLLAPTQAANNLFHSFTVLCENDNFLISSLRCFFANVTPCPLVLLKIIVNFFKLSTVPAKNTFPTHSDYDFVKIESKQCIPDSIFSSTYSLRKETSLTKHQNNPNDMTDDPVQRPTEKPSSNSSPGLQQKDFLVGRAPYVANDIKKGRPKSGSRPPSGRIQLGRTPVSAGNSLRTYQQLRKDGKLKTSDTRSEYLIGI